MIGEDQLAMISFANEVRCDSAFHALVQYQLRSSWSGSKACCVLLATRLEHTRGEHFSG